MMRPRSTGLVWATFLLLAILVPAYLARPAPAVAATSVSADVFAAAGGGAQGASYSVGDSFGQFPIGSQPASDGTELRDGLWATLVGRAPDTTPPELSVSVFQNPYITEHLDLFLIASEAVADTSVTLDVGAAHVTMEENNTEKHIWRGDYDLCCTGVLSIKAWARDISLNRGSVTRTFTSSMVLASSGGIASSPDLRLEACFPPGVLQTDAYVLVLDVQQAGADRRDLYSLSPTGLKIDGYVEVTLAYPETTAEPEHLAVGVLGEEGLVPLDSYVDRERGRLVAYVSQLGTYGLATVPGKTTPDYGGLFAVSQNAPNPFVGATMVALDVSKQGWISVEVLSVDGRVVRRLLDTSVTPGTHTVEWDGCDEVNQRAAPGVYLLRVRFGEETVTRKMVHLR